jgi:hypothetical protein
MSFFLYSPLFSFSLLHHSILHLFQGLLPINAIGGVYLVDMLNAMSRQVFFISPPPASPRRVLLPRGVSSDRRSIDPPSPCQKIQRKMVSS